MVAVQLVAIGVALLLGVGAGVALVRARGLARGRARLAEAEARGRAVLDEARRAAALTVREGAAGVRERALELERDAAAEQAAYRQECELIVERLRKLEARAQRRREALVSQQEAQRAREAAGSAREAEVRQGGVRARELEASFASALERQAGQTRAVLCGQLVEVLVEEARSRSADRLRNLDAGQTAEVVRQAKRLMGVVTQRYGGYYPRERGSATILLAEGQAAKLGGAEGAPLRALRAVAGIELLMSESGDALRMDTGDGMVRELCRRAVARLLAEDEVRDPQRLVEAIKRELEREVADYGAQAFRALGLPLAATEIVELVGRLQWRTSYTQNQYRHSIEAAQLAGMMAAELGLDVALARRATLLHDLGKSLTPLTEGSHALIGAAIARRCGEPEAVANAIGAHHGEEPMGSPYAWLATAADAMSGGRPGARREVVESYDERIGDLEQIAASFKGVHSVHAVQAGRELRIHVEEQRVRDADLPALCQAIAQKISDEVVFPGQIRVTVIREFRAVAEAR